MVKGMRKVNDNNKLREDPFRRVWFLTSILGSGGTLIASLDSIVRGLGSAMGVYREVEALPHNLESFND